MTKTITVKSCAECPFFATTLGSFMASMMAKIGDEPLWGECDAPAQSGLMHFPAGAHGPAVEAVRTRQKQRMRIKDGRSLPEKCPLRETDVLVTLGS